MSNSDPFLDQFGEMFKDEPGMPPSFRPKAGQPFYSPGRDLLYLTPAILKYAAWSIVQFSEVKENTIVYDGIECSKESVVDLFTKIKKILYDTHSMDACCTNLKEVVTENAWETTDPKARAIVMGAIGRSTFGMYYTSVFNSPYSESDANSNMRSFYDEITEVMSLLSQKNDR